MSMDDMRELRDPILGGQVEFSVLADRALTDYDQAAAAIGRLEQIGTLRDRDLRAGADRLLRNLASRAKHARPMDHQPTKRRHRGHRMSEVVEGHLVRLHQLLAPRRAESTRTLWAWTVASLVAVGAMSWAAVSGLWYAAAGLCLVRAAGSLFAGTPRFPTDNAPMLNVSPPSRVIRCVASHAGDAFALVGAGYALAVVDRPFWSMVMAASATVMLVGTTTRLASVQVGLCLNRKASERVLRRASLFAALVATGLTGGIPATGVPWLAVAALGPVFFAAFELWRICPTLLSMQPRSVILDVQHDDCWEQCQIYRGATGLEEPMPTLHLL